MIFIKNKYTKVYYMLMEKRKKEVLNKNNVYCESHHIIPKSLGGSNEKDNMVNLTAREHYIAHKLLTKMTTGNSKTKMFWAFHRIIHSKNSNFKINSKNYERFRVQWSYFAKENHPSKVTDRWSDIVSESIKKSWENDENRKLSHSTQMKEKWKDGRLSAEQSRINGNHGLLGKQIHNCIDIEYKGVIYYGWRELKEKTGVSKSLYKKYYLNGVDPEIRINANGPKPKSLNMNTIRKEGSV